MRLDRDRAGLRIPLRAWAVAGLGMVAAMGLVVSGEPISGAISKSVPITFHAPFWWAAGALCLGSAMSIWIGSLSRTSVAAWAAAVSAVFTGVLVLLPICLGAPLLDAVGWGAFIGMVFFPTLWLLQLPLGWLAASLPSPFRRRAAAVESVLDDRPHWERELTATLAALGDQRGALEGADLQQVAELAFALGNDGDAPSFVHQHAANLRSLLARDMDGPAQRAAIIGALEVVLATSAAANPYR
jgi:hypothetical protein